MNRTIYGKTEATIKSLENIPTLKNRGRHQRKDQ